MDVGRLWVSGTRALLALAIAGLALAPPAHSSRAPKTRNIQHLAVNKNALAANHAKHSNVKKKTHVDPLRIGPVLLGLLVGLGTVALQLWLKFISREPPDGKRHGLVRDDLVWWIEWVVAAAIAFTVLALTTAGSGGSLSELQIGALVIVFLVGFSGLPGLVRAFGYDKSNGVPVVRSGRGIFLPNLLGVVILMVAVISGASLAG